LPYAPKTAMMFGSLYEQDDSTPSSRCTRHLLERIVQQGLEAHDLCFVSRFRRVRVDVNFI
jgi:glutamine synthetase